MGSRSPHSHWHGKHVSQQLTAGSHFPLGSSLAQAHTSSLFYHSLTFSLSWRLRFAGSQNGPHAQEQLPTAQSKPSLLAHQLQPGSGQGEIPTQQGPPPIPAIGQPPQEATQPTFTRALWPRVSIPKDTCSGIAEPLNSLIRLQPSHPSRGGSLLLIWILYLSASIWYLCL